MLVDNDSNEGWNILYTDAHCGFLTDYTALGLMRLWQESMIKSVNIKTQSKA